MLICVKLGIVSFTTSRWKKRHRFYQLDESIFNFGGVWCTFSFFFFLLELIFRLANSEDPDQTPRSAASDLGLHYLPMSQK